MNRVRVNFVGGMVENDPLTISDTTLVSQGLVKLPAIEDGVEYVAITLDPDGLYGDPEIVWVTEHEEFSDEATILRGQENSTAREHNSDTYWVHAPTAIEWNEFYDFMNSYREPKGALVVRSTTMSIPSSTPTNIIWDSEVVDQGGFVDLTTHNTRITVTSGHAGWWAISAFVWWQPVTGLGRRLYIGHYNSSNELLYTIGRSSVVAASSHNDPANNVYGHAYADVGDYFVAILDQNDGSSRSIRASARMSAIFLGGSI